MISVTGGAGFIASHLVDALVQENDVTVIDAISSGKIENINKRAKLLRSDICEPLDLKSTKTLFHFAADPDVRASAELPSRSFYLNVKGTFSVLESCRKHDVERVVIASSSTVYGEAPVPTPEECQCRPISNYGASKLAGEAYLSSYCSTYGMKGTVLRFANIFGERSSHGVMFDFYHKLKKDSKHLEILGDGKQQKSYLHVSDAVSAIMTACKKQKSNYDVFNIGGNETVDVNTIAQKIARIMGVSPSFTYTGTKGWAGDVPIMLLDCSKLMSLGWHPEVGFEHGIEKYISWLSANQ